MKTLKHILAGSLASMAMFTACNQGIDDITPVAPGEDVSAPVVNIQYPLEGTKIQVVEDTTSIVIELDVTDDIEIGRVVVTLDGAEINSFNEFVDYRHLVAEFEYAELTDGTHVLDVVATDLSGKEASQSVSFEKKETYKPIFSALGEQFYMPMDGDYNELMSITSATKVGAPSFDEEAKFGKAYAGFADSYLTFPSTNVMSSEFSAAFWYKVNATPDRAGILVIAAPDEANDADSQNNRKHGFRLFREASGDQQRIKANIGNGDGEHWNDGGLIDVNDEWVHVTLTIGSTQGKIYINGTLVNTCDISPVSWEGCETMSIMSGDPYFNGWSHKYDGSSMDELRLFSKELSEEEIQTIIAL